MLNNNFRTRLKPARKVPIPLEIKRELDLCKATYTMKGAKTLSNDHVNSLFILCDIAKRAMKSNMVEIIDNRMGFAFDHRAFCAQNGINMEGFIGIVGKLLTLEVTLEMSIPPNIITGQDDFPSVTSKFKVIEGEEVYDGRGLAIVLQSSFYKAARRYKKKQFTSMDKFLTVLDRATCDHAQQSRRYLNLITLYGNIHL
ncbi:MAG: hypothetical protein ACYC69_09970 [Thermodesulfovibrionales bacterium]